MQQDIMDWKNLRQGKGQSVQEYMQVFRKKALTLGIPLYTQDSLLKYIGGMHSYLKHTILMFNPYNFDNVCVQVTHIEAGGGNTSSSSKKEFVPIERKKKDKKKATMKKEEGEKPTVHIVRRKDI